MEVVHLRPPEARGMLKEEFNPDNRTGAVPAERMKNCLEQKCPLFRQAMEIVEENGSQIDDA